MARRWLAGWLVAAVLLAGPAAQAADSLTVATDKGPVTGAPQGKTTAFLGIPYAAPPLGDLRFRPPAAHAAWTTPLAATNLGSPCPQNRGGTLGNEDCLFLNIWTPAPGPAKRPVMLWLHGGAFQLGTASLPYFNGQVLASQGDVVVVTINYRLGALGFLTAPALDGENARHVSGNYGLLDQQAALQWVRRNIAAFGGDPTNVTIFGQSAGANSVEDQLVSPLAKGLFRQAISESPVQNAAAEKLATAEAGAGAAIVKYVGCDGAADVAACLRAVPAEKFLTAPAAANPVVDGMVLPHQAIEAFRSGAFNHVPVMIGSNHDEWTAFVHPLGDLAELAYRAALRPVYGADADAVWKAYMLVGYPSATQAMATAQTDSNVACPVQRARTALARFVPVFSYEFSEPDPAHGQLLGPPVKGLDYGDYHTAEIPYVFGVAAPDGARLTGKDLALSDKMIAYWSNMARHGNPNGKLPQWRDFRAGAQVLSLQDEVVAFGDRDIGSDHRCAFWNGLAKGS